MAFPSLSLSGDRLHHVNSLLLVLSAVAAIRFPFETLLLSYALLGPLHYLTEISWLHEQRYFLKDSAVRGSLWVCLGVLLAFFGIPLVPALQGLSAYQPALMFLAFVSLPLLMFIPHRQGRWWAVAGAAVVGVVLNGYWLALIFAVWLVSLIHVFVFTGLFMVNGVLRTPTRAGWWAMGLFLGLPVVLLALPIAWSEAPSLWAQHSYGTFFTGLSRETLDVLGHPISIHALFENPWSIGLTRVMALAYTYHYLNWFSKPTVIRWHRVSRARWAVMLALWLGAVGLYVYNYALGFSVLAGLSFAHVILEFPLNHLSFQQLGQQVRQRWRGARLAPNR